MDRGQGMALKRARPGGEERWEQPAVYKFKPNFFIEQHCPSTRVSHRTLLALHTTGPCVGSAHLAFTFSGKRIPFIASCPTLASLVSHSHLPTRNKLHFISWPLAQADLEDVAAT